MIAAIVIGFAVVVVVLALACCKAAGDADQAADEALAALETRRGAP